MTNLLAFHNDPAIKDKYLARLRAHRAADEIIHGTYWQRGKGCAVGCTIHSGQHSAYETELGIPRVLARLEDRIFEGLQNGYAKDFPIAFLAAPKVGADLSGVWDRFALWLLADAEHGVRRLVRDGSRQAEAIENVAGLFRRKTLGEHVGIDEWRSARRAADAYAYAAAAAAAYAYAAAAAAAYADAAAAAAADAYAYAAAAAAAYAYAAAAAARQKFWRAAADKLVSLMAGAPVPAAESAAVV